MTTKSKLLGYVTPFTSAAVMSGWLAIAPTIAHAQDAADVIGESHGPGTYAWSLARIEEIEHG
jgi:hypothetical protein